MIEYTVKVDHVSTRWFLNGVLHREDGPAVEDADGSKYWYFNGNLHREDGPAIEDADGYKYWYSNGKLHREDGPAIEDADGIKRWFLNNEELTLEQFNTRTKAKELTVVEIESLLGYKIKVIGNA